MCPQDKDAPAKCAITLKKARNSVKNQWIVTQIELDLCFDIIYKHAKYEFNRCSLSKVMERKPNFDNGRTDTHKNILVSFQCLNTTVKELYLLAGRFTPAASVEVHVRRQRVPAEQASSMRRRSSPVRPLWWQATPQCTVYCRVGHMRPSPSECSSFSSDFLSTRFTSVNSLTHYMAMKRGLISLIHIHQLPDALYGIGTRFQYIYSQTLICLQYSYCTLYIVY